MKAFHDIYCGRRVLVTGHTGFKGSWLAHWLALLGAEVVGLSLEPNGDQILFQQLGLTRRLLADRRVDIRDAAAVQQAVREAAPDFLFHLAAQSLVRYSYQEPVETWATNVQGVVHVLEAVRRTAQPCIVVVVSSDKCYENRNRLQGYNELDRLGGHDPYSASKACAEIVTASYRQSFCEAQSPIKIASARAGNVVGGGDWSKDRIVPDCFRALRSNSPIPVRNKTATRPWQHVLEPLSGYLWLGAAIASPTLLDRAEASDFCSAFNFGPELSSNRTVRALVEELLKHAKGSWRDFSEPGAPHEAAKLSLAIDKAFHLLQWSPTWSFEETISRTVDWYQAESSGRDVSDITSQQIEAYSAAARNAGQVWADES